MISQAWSRGKRALLLVVTLLVVIGCFFALQHNASALQSKARTAQAQTTLRVLFDNAHAETAGNADWVMSTSQPDPLGENANPQVETDWTGGLSSWGVALERTGRYSLKTNISPLTYGNSANALDLSQYNALVLPEPNTLFTTSEKTAILSFVHNGGGLFMIADHNGSDRNNDGYDSLHIFNDLMDNSGVGSDPFGIQFDVSRIAKDYPGVDTPNPDPILQGPFGTGTTSLINQGTTETINPTDNPGVVGVIYTTGSSPRGTTGVFIARSSYGSGRVIAAGDSSAIDDGTCESGNKCYNGWGDPKAQNAVLYPNGTEWLASGSASNPTPTPVASDTPTAAPSPTQGGTPTGSDTPTPAASATAGP